MLKESAGVNFGHALQLRIARLTDDSSTRGAVEIALLATADSPFLLKYVGSNQACNQWLLLLFSEHPCRKWSTEFAKPMRTCPPRTVVLKFSELLHQGLYPSMP